MTLHTRPSLLLMTLLSTALCSANAYAHGEAVLCDAQGDLVEQCGEAHACVTDPEVSESIGYCKADTEEISFVLCDRSAPSCGPNEVCKIGTIDPNIGVCSELPELPETSEAGEEAQSEQAGTTVHNHDHDDHDDHDHDHDDDDADHDHGCQSAVGASSLSLQMGLLLALGGLLKRRSHPHDLA